MRKRTIKSIIKHLKAYFKCILWYGYHQYEVTSPFDSEGHCMRTCKRCGHKIIY